MSCGDEDRGRLLLGRWQLNQTLVTSDAETADLRIALLHHPWDYLAEFDYRESQRSIHQHADLLLRGHLHEAEAARYLPPDPSRACLELAAGCVYDGSQYPNAFQWIELWPEERRVKVHFRAWLHDAWTVDRNLPGCEKGFAVFDLTGKGSSPPPPPEPKADPRKYLDDLWQDTGHIDIRGLVTGRPEAHRFPIEALYIDLHASGGAAERSGPESPSSTLLQRALKNARLVIIGDPGSGKTTFLRWVAHSLAGDRLRKTTGSARERLGLEHSRVPVLVSIADWLAFQQRADARNRGSALNESADWLPWYLGTRAKEGNQRLTAEDFRRWLRDGDCQILLDGLDEAPDRLQRERAVKLIERVARAYADCPLVVTSRPAAYRDKAVLAGFAQTSIEALDTRAIDSFLTRWSRALFPDRPERAEAHRAELAAPLESRREIRLMARNTVMLTALAVVHWNEKRLPEQRAELYESIIKWLVEAREQRQGRLPAQRCRQLLAELALTMQTARGGRQVQVTRRWAAERLAPRFGADDEATNRAEAFLAEEELDSGIVVRRGHQLKFWHLTFQEYLAAQALAGKKEREQERLLLGPEPALYRPEWRETVLLLAGVLYLQGQDKVDGLVAAVLDHLDKGKPDRAAQARCAGLLGALVRDLDPFAYQPADPRYAQVLDAALAVFDPEKSRTIAIPDRIGAADALALAGDPRLGWLAPKRWVDLPGGLFLMGAQSQDESAPCYDPEAGKYEGPVHQVILDPFRIARFPVTVAEYAEFVEDGGYADPRWWQAGRPEKLYQPDDWDRQQGYPSRPVVNVSWYEAAAYCAWLTDRLSRPQGPKGSILVQPGQVVRLPTEAEWEFAARGSEGRRYPWGDAPPDEQIANFANNVGHVTPVGIYPGGATPEGVLELGDNVVEWCLDVWDEGYYAACKAAEPVTNPAGSAEVGPRVLRGGAFYVGARVLRATYRGWGVPVYRDRNIGFRCVLAPRRQP